MKNLLNNNNNNNNNNKNKNKNKNNNNNNNNKNNPQPTNQPNKQTNKQYMMPTTIHVNSKNARSKPTWHSTVHTYSALDLPGNIEI